MPMRVLDPNRTPGQPRLCIHQIPLGTHCSSCEQEMKEITGEIASAPTGEDASFKEWAEAITHVGKGVEKTIANTAASSGYSTYKTCTHKGDHAAITINGCPIVPLQQTYVKDHEPGEFTLLIDCTGGSARDMVLPPGYEMLRKHFTNGPPTIAIPWTDGSMPPLQAEFWRDLLKLLPGPEIPNRKVAVCCFGAHGRTGTALAAMVLAAEPKMTCNEAIRFVRKYHCKEAVETKSQDDYLEYVSAELGNPPDAENDPDDPIPSHYYPKPVSSSPHTTTCRHTFNKERTKCYTCHLAFIANYCWDYPRCKMDPGDNGYCFKHEIAASSRKVWYCANPICSQLCENQVSGLYCTRHELVQKNGGDPKFEDGITKTEFDNRPLPKGAVKEAAKMTPETAAGQPCLKCGVPLKEGYGFYCVECKVVMLKKLPEEHARRVDPKAKVKVCWHGDSRGVEHCLNCQREKQEGTKNCCLHGVIITDDCLVCEKEEKERASKNAPTPTA